MEKNEKRKEFIEGLKAKPPLNQKDRWLQNMGRAGEVHTYLSPQKDVRMPIRDCTNKTKIFNPASRG